MMSVTLWLGSTLRALARSGAFQAPYNHLRTQRSYSLLPAISRPQILDQKILLRRWRHDATLPAAEREKIIASKIETTSSRAVDATTASNAQEDTEKRDIPSYEITFTCKPCSTRSTHKISKQGYHKGTILITCPSCKNRHLICDHLNIFRDQSTTIEDILKEKGESIKHGTIGAEGDIEFWDDGSSTNRSRNDGKQPTSVPSADTPTP